MTKKFKLEPACYPFVPFDALRHTAALESGHRRFIESSEFNSQWANGILW